MEQKVIRFLVLAIVVSGFVFKPFQVSPSQSGTVVRVAILKEAKSVVIASRGKFEMFDPATDQVIFQGRVLRRITVHLSKNGLKIGDREYPVKRIRITPQKDVSIVVDNVDHRYRDDIDIVIDADQTLTVINTIELEKYIQGVLYHEVSHRWPLEAIKAQAIAVRTYALYQIEQNRSRLYDLTSDVYSQVYGGRNSERYRTTIAVRRTQAEVLTLKGKIFPAYYSSNCGGYREDVRELWDQDLPPLYGGPCPFCKGMPNSIWKKNFRSKDVQDKLNENGLKVGMIKEIKVSDRSASGRVRKLLLTDRDEKTFTISGKEFRQILGPNMLKSSLYDVQMQGYFFDIIGHGWGHGVGLCQWGSYGMSLQHYRYKDILKFYYPGTKIDKF